MSNVMFRRFKACFAIHGLGQTMSAPMPMNAPIITASLSTASDAFLAVDTVTTSSIDSIHTINSLSTLSQSVIQPKPSIAVIGTVQEAYANPPPAEYLIDVSVEPASISGIVSSFLIPINTASPLLVHNAAYLRGARVQCIAEVIIDRIGVGIVSDVSADSMDGCHVTEITTDNRVSIFSQDAQHDDVACEQAMMQPVVCALHTQFRTEVYVLSKEEGGCSTPCFNGLRPQFYFRTTDVIGAANLIDFPAQNLSGDSGTCSVKPAQKSDTVRTQQVTPFFTQPIATSEYSKVVN